MSRATTLSAFIGEIPACRRKGHHLCFGTVSVFQCRVRLREQESVNLLSSLLSGFFGAERHMTKTINVGVLVHARGLVLDTILFIPMPLLILHIGLILSRFPY